MPKLCGPICATLIGVYSSRRELPISRLSFRALGGNFAKGDAG